MKTRPNLKALHVALPQEAHRLMANPRPVVDSCFNAVLVGIERRDATQIRRWIDGLVKPIPINAIEACLAAVFAHFTTATDMYNGETAILSELSATARAHLNLAKTLALPNEAMRRAQVHTLIKIIDAVNPTLACHGENIGNFSRRLALAIELEPREIATVEYAGYLIGLGSILPDHEISRDTTPRHAIDRKSVIRARNVIREVAGMAEVAQVLHYLFEWVDGSGPEGFVAGEIPILSRILAIAHAFAEAVAIESNTQFAVRKLIDEQDRHYDGALVAMFLHLIGYRRSLTSVQHAN